MRALDFAESPRPAARARGRGVVYVLPENGDWRALWQARGRTADLDIDL